MPRKTSAARPTGRAGSSRFNEAAARCRGKPDAIHAESEAAKKLQ